MFENIDYLETVYSRFRLDPSSVPDGWKDFFNGNGGNGSNHVNSAVGLHSELTANGFAAGLNEKILGLIQSHRTCGHLIAAIDPLGSPRPCPPGLKLETYGFTENELNSLISLPTLHFDGPLTLRETFAQLRQTYCGSIGVQYMHMDDSVEREWIQRRMEDSSHRRALSRPEQVRFLASLTQATMFDEFLRKQFPGAKTFSLEGSETLIPLLDYAIDKAAGRGVRDVVIGMAHRGRLNVLAHVAGKLAREIFREFADVEPESWLGRGDVKYHLGHSTERLTAGGRRVHISLCFNPSHLEFINPIVVGRARARQDRTDDLERRQVLPLLIHGDAAFAGEGIVQETLNLERLAGYFAGGTLHIILNNQIGFTTSPDEGRSTRYATDVARMLQLPIFHVNGEDPEAVATVVQFALEFRHEFQRDVFVDLLGYRRWGHNETDEPAYTQPVLYRAIEQHDSLHEVYRKQLLNEQALSAEAAEQQAREFQEKLEGDMAAAKTGECAKAAEPHGVWENYAGGAEPDDQTPTEVSPQTMAELLRRLTELPESFHLHRKLERGMKLRRELAGGKLPIDWATAEALALASLATEGVRIRLTGQDAARGTFSHRHAVLYDQEDGFPYSPLQNLSVDQAPVEIVNSPLCEAGALGFEYGYSLDCPGGLVLWEAQFGDFVNAAQVIIDQFIAGAEDKWQRLSGLVLLLPHGFEGMGAEHSSARIERFLTLAAKDNLQIVQPTTPAQYFHLLRRQALRKWRKPLVVFTPKSLLRDPKVVSNPDDFSQTRFQHVLADFTEARNVKRILLCTGKICYALSAFREEHQRHDVAILRLEQLYPLQSALLERALQPYADQTPALWVQEEPVNMGAWRFLHEKFGRHLFGRLPFAVVSRPESASPATGSAGAHKLEQMRLIERAFSHLLR